MKLPEVHCHWVRNTSSRR